MDIFANRLPLLKTRMDRWDYNTLKNNTNIILLQHLREDSYNFIENLNQNSIKIQHVIGKPNSVDKKVIEKIRWNLDIPVSVKDYNFLDNSTFLDTLIQNNRDKTLSILEVWWYHLKPLIRQSRDDLKNILGVIEITKFWHNRYANYLNKHWKLPVPVISCAESKIKEIEADFVAKMGIIATDLILHSYGKTIANKEVWLLWFWMINSNVFNWLEKFKAKKISIFDIDRNKIKSKKNNFLSKKNILSNSEILISSTWTTSLTLEEIEQYTKDNTILVAMGSRGKEFPIEDMKKQRKHSEDDNIITFTTPNKKQIHILYQGIAVNYMLNSCPDEAMDPYFCEMIEWLKMLKEENLSTKKINTINPDIIMQIIREWKWNYNI